MSRDQVRLTAGEFRRILVRVFAALHESDRIILGRMHSVKATRKLDGSDVTAADRGAERLLRSYLRAAWPADALFGEEYGGSLTRSGRCWLLDPIDGTASYVLGIPMFGTLISLLVDGEPVFGCIHLAGLKETTFAATGHGCWLTRNGSRRQRVRVGPTTPLSRATIGMTGYKERHLASQKGARRMTDLLYHAARVRLVGDCVQYPLVCRGTLDAALDPHMKPWDIGALAPCVLEAGGSISDFQGNTTRIIERTSFVAASSAGLRRALCRRLAAE